MKVLITSASSGIGQTVASALGKHDLRLTDLAGHAGSAGRGRASIQPNELNHDDATDKLVAGLEAIVHIGYADSSAGPAWQQAADATALLDYYSRRTYNLLLAASNAKVERCIYVSTLRLLQDYEENLTVTERWRPHPPSDDPALLACHIGEIVCKEFARDRLIKTATVRLGWPVVPGARAKAARSGETAAIAIDDVATALNAALKAEIEQWQDIHVQSPVAHQRFLMHAAQKFLSFPSPAPQAPQAAPPQRAARGSPTRSSRKGGRK